MYSVHLVLRLRKPPAPDNGHDIYIIYRWTTDDYCCHSLVMDKKFWSLERKKKNRKIKRSTSRRFFFRTDISTTVSKNQLICMAALLARIFIIITTIISSLTLLAAAVPKFSTHIHTWAPRTHTTGIGDNPIVMHININGRNMSDVYTLCALTRFLYVWVCVCFSRASGPFVKAFVVACVQAYP